MNYYNPYRDEIKDDRIEIVFETTIDDLKIIRGVLHPKEINACPNCNSIDCIKYGHRIKK